MELKTVFRKSGSFPGFVGRRVENGRVKILGDYYKPREPAPQLEGLRLWFGLYWTWTKRKQERKLGNFIALWGTEKTAHMLNFATKEEISKAMNEDNELLTDDKGYFIWYFWDKEEA